MHACTVLNSAGRTNIPQCQRRSSKERVSLPLFRLLLFPAKRQPVKCVAVSAAAARAAAAAAGAAESQAG